MDGFEKSLPGVDGDDLKKRTEGGVGVGSVRSPHSAYHGQCHRRPGSRFQSTSKSEISNLLQTILKSTKNAGRRGPISRRVVILF